MRTLPSRTADERAPKVIALALKNPDSKTRRLIPLNGSKLSKPVFKSDHASKKAPARISPEVEERIAALSLKHPDYGARRLLPLIKAGGMSVSTSTVYRVMRRHGLQNRGLRHSKLEAQAASGALMPQAAAVPVQHGEQGRLLLNGGAGTRPQAAKPRPVAHMPVGKAQPTRVPRVSKKPPKNGVRGSGALTLVNILLLVLALYLGYRTVQSLRGAGEEPQETAAVTVPAPGAAEAPRAAVRPLSDYRTIWERNLFNVPKEAPQAPKKDIAVEEIALAETGIGLNLVGTVAADDARLRRAFIENSKTREQKAYSEGDAAGEVLIKKILRNRVVVATRNGDRLLTVDFGEIEKRAGISPPPHLAAVNPALKRGAMQSREPEVGVIEASLAHSQVETGLARNDYLMKQVQLYPYSEGGQPGGLRISNIRAGNVLLEMGLRSGDVITGVNGETVSGPDDADAFFRRLSEGGKVTIDINRRRSPMQIRLNIG